MMPLLREPWSNVREFLLVDIPLRVKGGGLRGVARPSLGEL